MMRSGEFDILKRLEELMDARGISIYALSRSSGIPYSTLATWRKNGVFPHNDSLLKLCSALDITIPEFFNGCTDLMIADEDDITHMRKYHLLSREQKKLIDSSMNMFLNEKN